MPSLIESPETGTSHAVSLAPLLEGMFSGGVRLLVSVVLGLLAARLLRRRGVHWGWSVSGATGALLLRPALGGVSVSVALAGLVAARRLRRWHRQDLEAGGDLAGRARARRSPAAMARALTRRSLLSDPRAQGRGGELVLGISPDGEPVAIPFGDAAGRHTLVLGATGSGKTVTQTLMAVSAIERDLAAIVVDPKGDGAMREALCEAAALAGREFLEWTPGGPSTYNPYARGSETEIADRLLAGERFTEPHYLRQAQRYLGHAIRALRAADGEVCLQSIVRQLDPVCLEELLRELPEQQAEAGHAYLDSLTARQLRDLTGVRDRLAILTESDVGRWLEPAGSATPSIDLLAAARSGAVVYLSLESDSRPLLAQMLGAAIVQDLQSTIAALQGRPAPTLVVIDEFSAVAAEQVVALFGRARSAGFSLLLGTQELSDLRLPGHERLLEQVLGNLSALIAHRQVVPRSAELIAGMGGVGGAWRVSFSSDGRTTRTRSSERVLQPDELLRLEPGRCFVIGLGSGQGARAVRITPAGAGR